MPAERDDVLTPAQEIFARVLTDAIVEGILAEGLTESTPDEADARADAEHESVEVAACR